MPPLQVLNDQGIHVGVKVDTGLTPLFGTAGECGTAGLDGLKQRADQCKKASRGPSQRP